MPANVVVTTAQTVVGTGDPLPLDYSDVVGRCCYDCVGLLSEDEDLQDGFREWIGDTWDCSKPQCFNKGYTFNSGSLGEVLAQSTNSLGIQRLPVPVDEVTFPWLLVANQVANSCCAACDNPEINIQGREYGVLGCVDVPESCYGGWSFEDREVLSEAGFAVYGPLQSGCGAYTNYYIHHDRFNWNYDDRCRENFTFRSGNSLRLNQEIVLQLAELMEKTRGLSIFSRSTQIREGVKGTTRRMMHAKIKEWATRNVGVLFSDFDNVQRDISVKSDFEVKNKCRGTPGTTHIEFTYNAVERDIQKWITTHPRLLQNCDRQVA